MDSKLIFEKKYKVNYINNVQQWQTNNIKVQFWSKDNTIAIDVEDMTEIVFDIPTLKSMLSILESEAFKVLYEDKHGKY